MTPSLRDRITEIKERAHEASHVWNGTSYHAKHYANDIPFLLQALTEALERESAALAREKKLRKALKQLATYAHLHFVSRRWAALPGLPVLVDAVDAPELIAILREEALSSTSEVEVGGKA